MAKQGEAVEPRLEALQRILASMTQCLSELDELGASLCAVHLDCACDTLRGELRLTGGGLPHDESGA